MKNKIKFLMVVLVLISISCATSTREFVLYEDILSEARSENIHFALMRFNNYLKEFPETGHKQQIKFAICELYAQINDFQDAIRKLKEYIEEYPQEKSTVFARALLYRAISEYKSEPALIEKIKEGFFSKSLFLVFSESKTKSYRSILDNTYKIVDYIDKIEFYKNNALILSVSP